MLFQSLGTQWRVGMCGPYGLDYNVLYRKLDRMDVGRKRADDLETDVRILEDAALGVMHEEDS